MGALIERYGLSAEQERRLVRDGLIPLSFLIKFEIWQHFETIKKSFKRKEDAVLDCQFHFKVSRDTVYRALRLFK